jgi:hypothetical protein
MCINLHVLDVSGGMIVLWMKRVYLETLDTGIEPVELDFWSEKIPSAPFYQWIPETRNLCWDFLWSKIESHTGLGFCVHRTILFTPGHAHQLTSSVWFRWDECSLDEQDETCLFGDTGIEPVELDFWSEKIPIAPFYQWIPETRNLSRFLVSGIQWKNGVIGIFSDHVCCVCRSPMIWTKDIIRRDTKLECKNNTRKKRDSYLFPTRKVDMEMSPRQSWHRWSQ